MSEQTSAHPQAMASSTVSPKDSWPVEGATTTLAHACYFLPATYATRFVLGVRMGALVTNFMGYQPEVAG
jgi:hypothetical protein